MFGSIQAGDPVTWRLSNGMWIVIVLQGGRKKERTMGQLQTNPPLSLGAKVISLPRIVSYSQ